MNAPSPRRPSSGRLSLPFETPLSTYGGSWPPAGTRDTALWIQGYYLNHQHREDRPGHCWGCGAPAYPCFLWHRGRVLMYLATHDVPSATEQALLSDSELLDDHLDRHPSSSLRTLSNGASAPE